MDILVHLKQKEIILALSYWENFKYVKDMAKSFGGGHPVVTNLTKDLNSHLDEWNDIKKEIKKLEAEGI